MNNLKKDRTSGRSKRVEKMSNPQLSSLTGIPVGTLSNWSKSTDYKRDLYLLLKNFTKEELEELIIKTKDI